MIIEPLVKAAWSRTIGEFVYMTPEGEIHNANEHSELPVKPAQIWFGDHNSWNNTFNKVVSSVSNAIKKRCGEKIPYGYDDFTLLCHPKDYPFIKNISSRTILANENFEQNKIIVIMSSDAFSPLGEIRLVGEFAKSKHEEIIDKVVDAKVAESTPVA